MEIPHRQPLSSLVLVNRFPCSLQTSRAAGISNIQQGISNQQGERRMRIQKSVACVILPFRALGTWIFRVGYWVLPPVLSNESGLVGAAPRFFRHERTDNDSGRRERSTSWRLLIVNHSRRPFSSTDSHVLSNEWGLWARPRFSRGLNIQYPTRNHQ